MPGYIRKGILILWVGPNSLLGLLVGFVGLTTQGRARATKGVLEFHGGFVSWLLRRAPLRGGASAMALGHVILGQDRDALDRCRAHELVHVAQYERWGPLFLPAYFVASLVVWLRGGDAYRDNPFEVEAYGKSD